MTADRKKGINYRGLAMAGALTRDTSTYLSPHERLVAMTILHAMTDETKGRLSDGTPAIWMSAPMLARRCGFSPNSERNMRRHVKRLTDLGIIRAETRKGGATNLATLFAPGDIKWAPRRKDGSFDFAGLLSLADGEPSGSQEPEGAEHPGPDAQTIRAVEPRSSGSQRPEHPGPRTRPENSREKSREKSNREEDNPDLDWGGDTEGDLKFSEESKKNKAVFSGGGVYQESKADILASLPSSHPGDY